ncbi:type IV pilus twitching motility protein PilT [Alkalibacterium pelagium]|uniref:Twitching motility protein PilT n=1 Tax=Alkalibacterium pelagium TaxID=426702 RepID=A0A1H7KU03_9LACT|nr:type IV pilus twitching motility protein PilT [Alkalibacterium pelagium]GEN50650.1 twitching motility protein PilT [Alkalibacterium pelagium]SEK90242.1 twitching motility protein PilT [Alkalibacterium pelagium]
MDKLIALLTKAHYKEASDVHLVAGSSPVFRVDGKLMPEKEDRLMPDDTMEMARAILTDKLWDQLQEVREVDLSYGIPGVSRFRVNIFYQRSAISLAFRVIPRDIPTIDSLGIPQRLKELVKKPHGLILVTGPTGSGKSTSLASMIDYMNHEMNRHIITLEDPIEYLHSHNKCIIEQREVGFDTLSFKDGLRASLRQDPDVILVGELRDLDTIQTAITAAETGHLVLGTLHTQDTTGTIDRIIDVFPVHQKNQVRTMLANVLIGVMSQRLFPTLNIKGRVAATELLINNAAIKNLIRNEKMHQIPNVLQTSKDQGMHTMEMDMRQLIAEKRISELELLPYVSGQ